MQNSGLWLSDTVCTAPLGPIMLYNHRILKMNRKCGFSEAQPLKTFTYLYLSFCPSSEENIYCASSTTLCCGYFGEEKKGIEWSLLVSLSPAPAEYSAQAKVAFIFNLTAHNRLNIDLNCLNIGHKRLYIALNRLNVPLTKTACILTSRNLHKLRRNLRFLGTFNLIKKWYWILLDTKF